MSERERFEKWWAEYRGFNDPHDGEAWDAWQAALAAAPVGNEPPLYTISRGPDGRATVTTSAAPAPEPVAWRAKAQCGMYEGMWEFSDDKSDLINPEPLYAAPMGTP